MEINIKFIFLIIGLLVLFISFILQSILCVSTSFKSFNYLITNWKKTPIIGFSLSKNNEGYNENEFFKIHSTTIYIKRMDKKYNFLFLKRRSIDIFHRKNECPFYSYSINFKKNEECPINYINLLKEYNLKEKHITLNISDSEFLEYCNNENNFNHINSPIVVDIYFNKSSENLTIEKYNYPKYFNTFSEDDEMILSINSRLKYKNIAILIIFIFYIILIIVIIFNKNIYVFYLCYFILMFFSFTLISLSSLGIVWIKQANSILTKFGYYNYKMSKSLFNIEKSIISFIIFFSVIILIFLPQNIKLNDKISYCLLFFFLVIFIFLSPILGFIIIILKPFYNRIEFNDLKSNYQMSPITDIQISNYSNIINNKDSSYFNPKLPYKLSYIYLYEDNDFDDYLTKWKGYSFYITRMNKEYTYPYIINHNLQIINYVVGIVTIKHYIFLKMKNVQLIILNLMKNQNLH